MICYKDITFCSFYKECKDGDKCKKALTPKIVEDAKKWWGSSGAPISLYINKPDCFK